LILKEEYECNEWIHLTQDREQWQELVNMKMKEVFWLLGCNAE
jgi:hypothetical protein